MIITILQMGKLMRAPYLMKRGVKERFNFEAFALMPLFGTGSKESGKPTAVGVRIQADRFFLAY